MKTWAVRLFQAVPPFSLLPGQMMHAKGAWSEDPGLLSFREKRCGPPATVPPGVPCAAPEAVPAQTATPADPVGRKYGTA